MKEIETRTLYPSKVKDSLLILGSFAFVAIGSILVKAGQFIGWFSIIFFGICFLVGVLMVLPNSSYLKLDPVGFEIRSLFRSHHLKWSDVQEFSVAQVGVNKAVVFNFRAGFKMLQSSRKLSFGLIGYEGSLPDSYGKKHEELATLMNRYIEANLNSHI